MKILFCIPTLGYGGAEKQLSYLAVELTRMGHEIHVVYFMGGANVDSLREGGVTLHPLPPGGSHDPKIFFRLVSLIRKIKPDVVQTSLPQMDILGGAAALATGVRWVLKESSTAAGYSTNWKVRLRRVLARRADAIVSNSRQGEAYWRSNNIKCPLSVIPNGISCNATSDSSAADLDLEPDERLLLYAGRMDRGKNLENLVTALSLVAKDIPFKALLCGDGPLRPALEELATRLNIKPRVIFAGYVSTLWSLMRRADAFVFISRFEGCPNVVLEAMACGCPLIVSDIAAHREILDDRSACFVNLDEVTEIAGAIKTTLRLREATLDRADVARERVAQWTTELMAQRYEQVYLAVIAPQST